MLPQQQKQLDSVLQAFYALPFTIFGLPRREVGDTSAWIGKAHALISEPTFLCHASLPKQCSRQYGTKRTMKVQSGVWRDMIEAWESSIVGIIH
jgi:hypothetical protein